MARAPGRSEVAPGDHWCSRGITAAWQRASAPDAWLDASGDAFDTMNDDINAHR